MVRKALAFIILCVFFFTLQGCETLKGAASGMKKDWGAVETAWGKLQKADAWMQKNLW